MLYPLILTVHLIACFILIGVILLQAGRGGGLTDTGGGAAQSVLGTRGASFLTRATSACAVIFMLTSLSLAMLSAQRGRSLMENIRPKAEAPVKAAVPAPQP
ncbi:MAG: preprotein translocase subunit SecG [Candidatus Omnitrophota bacterium]|nr:preprotein translocase subunit SecG [Candidatus Omnitrophota bacterium]